MPHPSRLLALAASVTLLSCTDAPPMQMDPEVAERTPGRFVWYDLVTNDVRAAQIFYGQLFGWEFEDVPAHPGQFVLIRLDGIAIGGLVFSEREQPDSSESRWIGSVSVTDVDAAVQVVRDQGGEVLGGPTNIPLRGRVAVIADPQGAILALMRTEDGDPADRDPEMNDWLWQELWTTDDSSALGFYRDLMGYQHETLTVEAGAYHVLQLNGHSYAGLARLPWDSVPPTWLPYIRVDDPRDIAARVEALGGRVVLSPDQIRDGHAAVIEDPTGGVLAVQQWPLDGDGGDR